MQYYLQGLTKPFPTFIKLNPAIPDLSIPELHERIQVTQKKQVSYHEIECIHACISIFKENYLTATHSKGIKTTLWSL